MILPSLYLMVAGLCRRYHLYSGGRESVPLLHFMIPLIQFTLTYFYYPLLQCPKFRFGLGQRLRQVCHHQRILSHRSCPNNLEQLCIPLLFFSKVYSQQKCQEYYSPLIIINLVIIIFIQNRLVIRIVLNEFIWTPFIVKGVILLNFIFRYINRGSM